MADRVVISCMVLCMQCGYEHKAKCTSHCIYTFEYNSTCVHWCIAQSLIASMRSENVLASAHVPRHTGVMLRNNFGAAQISVSKFTSRIEISLNHNINGLTKSKLKPQPKPKYRTLSAKLTKILMQRKLTNCAEHTHVC